jgi:UDP-2,3-diacylglucosamine pyrophosphatase LpxH
LNFIFRVVFSFLCLVPIVFADTHFLVISDIHYGSGNKIGEDTDTGDEFLQVALDKFKQLTKKVEFILVLGDLPTHSLFVRSKKEAYEQKVFHGLYEADTSLKPMFYITGNNDSLSGNYQPFESEGKSPLNFAKDWTGSCVHCEGLIINDKHMRKDGYYSSYVIPHNKDILLIALNSIQWTKTPFFATKYPNQRSDALKQLLWLEQQLKTHHAKQLLLAMHIPPGNNYKGTMLWHQEYVNKFIYLLEKYHASYDQISLLISHTHMDEIRKIDLKDHANIYAYSTPSISRNHHNNPGIKIFTLDKYLALKNYTTFYTTSLNKWGNEQYQALGATAAIFPNCTHKNLSQCLNGLSNDQVCNKIEQGLFYGVKSPRVFKNVCTKTYRVH